MLFPPLATPLAQLLAKALVLVAPLAPAAPPDASLSALLADPTDALGAPVRSHVQLHSAVETWSPFLTRFGAQEYAAFQVWTDEQFLWEKAAFEAPAARLFARRGSQAERHLARASRYDRLVVNLVPREYFAGELWIEVVQAIPCRAHVPEGAILHAIRARDCMDRKAWSMACGELDRALAAPLPAHARVELDGLRTRCASAAEARGEARPMEAQVERTPSVRADPAPRR